MQGLAPFRALNAVAMGIYQGIAGSQISTGAVIRQIRPEKV